MHSTTTQPNPAPAPDAQPVQAANSTPGPWTNKDTLVMTSEGNYVADCGMKAKASGATCVLKITKGAVWMIAHTRI